MKKLEYAFHDRTNVVAIAKELLGKIIVTNFNNNYTSARIVETEPYGGVIDRASHAFGKRRTNRTEVIFGRPGKAYVYLCYGIHHLFNIVTNRENIPHAVLIRAAEPIDGVDIMLQRTGKAKADYTLTKGPGNVSKALGIRTTHTGLDLLGDELFIADDGMKIKKSDVVASARIGVDYAGDDALLHYRFNVKGNKFVSGKNSVASNV